MFYLKLSFLRLCLALSFCQKVSMIDIYIYNLNYIWLKNEPQAQEKHISGRGPRVFILIFLYFRYLMISHV